MVALLPGGTGQRNQCWSCPLETLQPSGPSCPALPSHVLTTWEIPLPAAFHAEHFASKREEKADRGTRGSVDCPQLDHPMFTTRGKTLWFGKCTTEYMLLVLAAGLQISLAHTWVCRAADRSCSRGSRWAHVLPWLLAPQAAACTRALPAQAVVLAAVSS